MHPHTAQRAPVGRIASRAPQMQRPAVPPQTSACGRHHLGVASPRTDGLTRLPRGA